MSVTVLLQYALPHRVLSRLVYWATRSRIVWWKNFLIRQIVRRYNVDLGEAAQSDISTFVSFNAFFTRALKQGARTAAADPRGILMPADGRISQIGAIRQGRIFQAKGQEFSVAELLADAKRAEDFENGTFATIYLSPRDYHRAHMPLAGTLTESVHVPGRLFSVAPAVVAQVPRLFARNERVVFHFQGEHGPFAVVMVGAMLVSSVETVWGGLEIPPYANGVVRKDYRDREVRLERFAEMARFNMGSTVIVLFPTNRLLLDPNWTPEAPVRLGQLLGTEITD
jgi:phosphatidylserine decarboxylase